MDNSDTAFFGTILALFMVMCGHPFIALIVFVLAVS